MLGRGLEAAIDSVAFWPADFELTIRGPGDAGYLDARCLICLPLSPSSAFFAAHEVWHLNMFNAMPGEVLRLWINTHIVREARSYIYGTDPTDEDFIRDFADETFKCGSSPAS